LPCQTIPIIHPVARADALRQRRLLKAGNTGISSQLTAGTAFIGAVQPAGSGGNTPKAFLTILFFDERFNFITAADGGVAQSQVATSVTAAGATLAQMNIKAPKNGYVFAYVSNQSDQMVYFDNLKVGITTGNLIEEDHYYAFGMKITGISSTKLGDVAEGVLKNNYLYNDKEFFDDGGLSWSDYGFRNYDLQIGRFMQMDPVSDDLSPFSPYHYAYNDPIGNIDLDGLFGVETLTTVTVVSHLSKAPMAFTSMLSAVSLVANTVQITFTVLTAVTASAQINGTLISVNVGQIEDKGNNPGPKRYWQGVGNGFRNYFTELKVSAAYVRNHPLKSFIGGPLMALKGAYPSSVIGMLVSNSQFANTYIGYLRSGDYYQMGFMGGGKLAEGTIDLGLLLATEGAAQGFKFKAPVMPETISAGDGGLNLFKFNTLPAENTAGWKTGDRFLNILYGTAVDANKR